MVFIERLVRRLRALTRRAHMERELDDELQLHIELEQQKNRLSTYQVQARFALATMYDRAANPGPDTIDFAPALTGQTIQLNGTQLPTITAGPGRRQSSPSSVAKTRT